MVSVVGGKSPCRAVFLFCFCFVVFASVLLCHCSIAAGERGSSKLSLFLFVLTHYKLHISTRTKKETTEMPVVGIQPYAERDASGGPVCDVTGARGGATAFVALCAQRVC